MSQSDVLKYLKRCKKWKSSKEIAEAINLPVGSINHSLQRLYAWKKVKFKIIPPVHDKPWKFWKVMK